jgi:hypothetical protein
MVHGLCMIETLMTWYMVEAHLMVHGLWMIETYQCHGIWLRHILWYMVYGMIETYHE